MKVSLFKGALAAAFAGLMSVVTWAQAPAPAPARPAPAPAARPAPPAQAPAAAPAPAAAAAPKQMTSSVTATLYRVDEGMFDLRRGQSVDLTDRKVLMTFRLDQRQDIAESKYINLSINGSGHGMSPGQRLDLKNFYNLNKVFADKSVCFIDLIDVAVPKGAQPAATFRFECE